MKKGGGKMQKILVITGNQGKVNEISAITGLTVEAKKLELSEIQSLSVEEVAKKKVMAAYEIVRQPVLVDDTGMNIEALNGLPGALVVWFLDLLGPQGVLDLIANKKNRKASVSTCIAYADANGVQTFIGTVNGTIPTELRGDEGFGYDPIFIPEGQNKTYAEMSVDEKNEISMRKIALMKFKDYTISKNAPESEMSLDDLGKLFEETKQSDKRKAAEVAYVLAKIYLDKKDMKKATDYGKQSIQLFDQCDMETMEDCVARYTILSGIVLPDLIHQDVVRNRLMLLEL
ncbi:RdgB/HAM1 family non-canonical purine NTP pyrophosphatase [Candidatus Parcubacteria bacterium]|nr:RdgB/HAM1 family non-canonical purine NTP pyrophosphatase [Candidatus Parcubacteria bacterium]